MGFEPMSIIGLFLEADPIVKLVLIVLIVASFWSWTIIFEKVMRFRRLRGQAEKFEESFWSGGSLEELYDRIGKQADHPMAAIFAILLGLQGNIKTRLLRGERWDDAVEMIETMLLFAPGEIELWREAGLLHNRLDHVAEAVRALEEYLRRTAGGDARYNTSVLLQELRDRLN